MSADPFHLNRPVHLARRDVFYEKAVQRIQSLSLRGKPEKQQRIAEQALFMLGEARRHAEAANRAEKTSVQSRLFVSFLETAADHTRSIARMLRRRSIADTPENALDRFLTSGDVSTETAGYYRRCAGLMLKGLLSILQAGEKPLQDLQKTSLAKMTLVDKSRYEKAYHHFSEQADQEAEASSGFLEL